MSSSRRDGAESIYSEGAILSMVTKGIVRMANLAASRLVSRVLSSVQMRVLRTADETLPLKVPFSTTLFGNVVAIQVSANIFS
jgi:hypothetical protein